MEFKLSYPKINTNSFHRYTQMPRVTSNPESKIPGNSLALSFKPQTINLFDQAKYMAYPDVLTFRPFDFSTFCLFVLTIHKRFHRPVRFSVL